MAQRIVIPGFRKIETSSGGGGGTSNYNDLTNKPSINNVPLVGNLNTVNLKLTDATLTEEGVPAEARTVGELINTLNSNINYVTPVLISKESVKIEPNSSHQYDISQIVNRNYLEIYFYSGYNGYRYNICIPLGGVNVPFQQDSKSNSHFSTTYDKTNKTLVIRNNSSIASITIYRILSVYK